MSHPGPDCVAVATNQEFLERKRMAISLRDIAQRCLGLTPPFSVNTDVYGYMFRDTDGSMFGTLQTADILPGTNTATERSLKRHLETIPGRSTVGGQILVG